MRNIASIKERILEYLEYKGVTKYRFYLDSGIARGVLDKPTGLTEENIIRFIYYAKDVALNWLILGKGSMIKFESSAKDLELVSLEEYKLIIDELQKDNFNLKKDVSSKDKLLNVQEEMIYLLKDENKRLKAEKDISKQGYA